MMATSDFNFACEQCPRTFKLQEFYDKHQRVHALKKQHVCTICGYVYGAAKGLEGHMETAHTGSTNIKQAQPQNLTIAEIKTVSNNNNTNNKNNNSFVINSSKGKLTGAKPTVSLLNIVKPTFSPPQHKTLIAPQQQQSQHHLPFGLSLQLLQHQHPALLSAPLTSVAEQARLAQENASLLQKAHKSMLEAQMKNMAVAAINTSTGRHTNNGPDNSRGLYIASNGSSAGLTALSLVPISIAASPSPPNTIMSSGGSSIISPSASSTSSNSPTSRSSVSSSCSGGDKSKIPSPAGTGNYKIYGNYQN